MMMTMTLSAGEAPTPVLMGYQRLDPAGIPQDIRVALTKADLTAMWQRAQADTSAPAVCDLATGTPRFSMRFADGHLLGTMSLAVAVPGKVWRQVTLPFLAGSVRGVSARPLAGVDPGTVAWTSDQTGNLVLTLAPLQQADVIVDLDIPLTSAAGSCVGQWWQVAGFVVSETGVPSSTHHVRWESRRPCRTVTTSMTEDRTR